LWRPFSKGGKVGAYGGAGVGKTVVTRTFQETVYHRQTSTEADNTEPGFVVMLPVSAKRSWMTTVLPTPAPAVGANLTAFGKRRHKIDNFQTRFQ